MQPTYRTPASVNGVLILVLGILSIVGLPILGPVAWIMGNKGLGAIDAGGGDFQQRRNTMIGRICGIIGTAILVLGVIAAIAAFAFGVSILKSPLAAGSMDSGAGPRTIIHAGAHRRRASAPSFGSALSEAIAQNDASKVKAIAHKSPAALNVRGAHGQTPIFQAVAAGNPAMTGLLLRLGANVNARDDTGSTPLDKSRATGRDDVLAVLVSHGGKP